MRAAPATPPAQPAPTAADWADLPALTDGPSDAGNIDEVELPARSVAVFTGEGTWDNGFRVIFDAIRKVREELAKADIKPTGRPLAVFLDTDDTSFRFQAMVPIAAIPADKSQLTPEIRFGTNPSGKALRFTHKAPYDEIDNTYEAITAYLDAKGIVAKEAFIEEYRTDPKDASDPDLQINVYVQPK